jgi:hypothetical protein
MTSEELKNKYPDGIVLTGAEKVAFLAKLDKNEQFSAEEAIKLRDAFDFMESNSFTLNHALSIVKRNHALLRLQMKLSLGQISDQKDNDELFLAEVQHIDAIIVNEINALFNGTTEEKNGGQTPESSEQTTSDSAEKATGEGAAVATAES